MLENILDIDMAMRLTSFAYSKSSLLLFDFEAAFPSINHSYMWEVLRLIGVPQHILHAFQQLYKHNKQRVRLRSHVSQGFLSTSGVVRAAPFLLFSLLWLSTCFFAGSPAL